MQALIHGLNRHYYSISISYRKNELEERMLMNLQKKAWTHGLAVGCASHPRVPHLLLPLSLRLRVFESKVNSMSIHRMVLPRSSLDRSFSEACE